MVAQRYTVKEVYRTIVGEGARTGAAVLTVRFSGCNLWDGHPLHRDMHAAPCARWCDADFFKGRVLEADDLEVVLDEAWPKTDGQQRWLHLTGGEPMVQVDVALVDALKTSGWKLSVETNGTVDSAALRAFDYVTVSPKRGVPLAVTKADELKVVLPGAAFGEDGWTDDEVLDVVRAGTWGALYVQAQDPILDPSLVSSSVLRPAGTETEDQVERGQALYNAHLSACLSFIHRHPEFRLSLQAQKQLALP